MSRRKITSQPATCRKYLLAHAHNHRRSPGMVMRATLRFERNRKILRLDAFRQWRINHRCAATRIRLEQACRNGCASVSREQPQLVNFLRWQGWQITGEENQVAITTLINCLTS